MHPLLLSGGRLALYGALWLGVGALLTALLAGEAEVPFWSAGIVAFPLAVGYSFICLSAWYVSRATPLATSAPARIITTCLGASLATSAAWLMLARAWNALAGGWTSVRMPFAAIALSLFTFGVLLYLLSIAVAYIVVAFEQAREAERRELQAQVHSREAELRTLRAQIDPHFLFNSLHSISALTAADPAGARRMTILLADFFRESLALGALERISLSREVALVQKYLEIERIRLGDRLRTDVSLGPAGECEVPPLVLQPLVENAVKHGIAHLLEGGTITITASCTAARLTVVVENPADEDRPRRPGTNLGIGNVRGRLHALYGREASVTAVPHGDGWRTELTFPATRRA